MKVSGFTFIKNAVLYDYPIVEAINSILPLCDELIVAVGKSSDKTKQLIASINSDKIKIIDTEWDENAREGGRVLAMETDKAFAAIAKDSDWAFYIQGDEVVHEKYLETIYANMKLYLNDKRVDGLLFNYVHFYGSYQYVGASSKWYKNEIRIVKNNPSIYSFKDAQGFRKGNNQKLVVKHIDAFIYHYGWVKEPAAMQQKQQTFNKLWHTDEWMKQHIKQRELFDYSEIDSLQIFNGSHPAVMLKRIAEKNWTFDHDLSRNKHPFKEKFKLFLKTYLGIDTSYKNYEVL